MNGLCRRNKRFNVDTEFDDMKSCMGKNSSAFLCSLCLFFTFLLISPEAHPAPSFSDINISTPFDRILLQHQEFMRTGGARGFRLHDGTLAVVGIGKTIPDDYSAQAMLKERKKGEMRARSAILGLAGGVAVGGHDLTFEFDRIDSKVVVI